MMGGEDTPKTLHLQEENAQFRATIAELQSQLHQCESDKKQLQNSYEEALQALADSEAKKETSDRELKMAHQQMASMWKELESLHRKLDGPSGNSSVTSGLSLVNEDSLELQCTLCKEKIKVRDLKSHSETCSSPSHSPKPSDKKTSSSSLSPPRPSPQKPVIPAVMNGEEYLVVNVTRTPPGTMDLAPFKIVTKTNMSQFSQPVSEVHRSQGDFQWLFESLQDACPERIVPPLKPPISLDATMSEFQRFLSRIAAHKVLRKHHLFIMFLSGLSEEVRSLRAKHRPHRLDEQIQYKPAVGRDTNSGPLVATKEYLTALEQNVLGLATHLEQSSRRKTTTEKTGHWFRAISESESNDTYLRTAANDLARTCEAMEGQQNDSDETLFIHNLQSVADYVRTAQNLLTRVEDAVDRFLYWDEEVTIIEAVTSSPTTEHSPPLEDGDSGVSDITSSSNNSSHAPSDHVTSHDQTGSSGGVASSGEVSMSEKWAQASKYCTDAKDYLEMMCHDLAEELSLFDLQKEKELKQVLLDYAAAQLERHEKFQGKWFAMRYLLDTPIVPGKRAIQFSNVAAAPAPPQKNTSNS